jgi:drug/metabolite transporter (DMT)-like permease
LSDRSARTPLWRVYAIAILATVIWSINYIFAKYALLEFPPMLISGLRNVIAAVVMFPVFLWHRNGDERPEFTRKDMLTLGTLGLLGVGMNQVFFVLGISRTSVAHAAVIVGLTPVLVLVIAALLGEERMKRMQMAGMVLALVGVVVLQLSSTDRRQSTLLGDLLIFCGCMIFAVFAVRSKRETRRMGPIVLNTFAYVSTGIALLPVTLWYSRSFAYEGVTWQGWASLFYMAAFSSVLGYLMFYYALSHMPASRVSTFTYLQPLIAMALAMIFLGERPTTSLFSGGALVLAGVFIAERT